MASTRDMTSDPTASSSAPGETRQLRPLIPVPPNNASRGPTSIPDLSNLLKSTRKKSTITACTACRKRRTKCTAERPQCGRCVSLKLDCVYPIGETRHQTSAERTGNEPVERQSSFEEIYELLKERPDAEALEIFRRIREGADAGALLRQIRNGSLLLQLKVAPESRYRFQFPFLDKMPAGLTNSNNPYLNSLIYAWSSQQDMPANTPTISKEDDSQHYSLYLKPYYAAEVVNPKLDLVMPSKWTTVSADDHLMRRLLKLYFLTEYWNATFFRMDDFLDAMIAGSYRFCSPLLVNTVLAIACIPDRDNTHRSEFWNTRNMAYRFLAEARRLFEMESPHPQLTTIQAALTMNMLYNMNGADEIGYEYLLKAVEMANRLGISGTSTEFSDQEQSARTFTAWCLYGWQARIVYMYQRRPLIDRPPDTPLPDPSENPDWYGEIYVRFPSSPVITRTYLGDLICARIRQFCIAQEINAQSTKDSEGRVKLSVPHTIESSAKLMLWYQSLPIPLRPDRIATPVQLQLHMQFHNMMVNLLEEPTATDLDSPQHADIFYARLQRNHREVLADSKRGYETVVRLYYLRHGFENVDSWMIHYLSLLAFLANGIAQTSPEESPNDALQSTIILGLLGLCYQGNSHYLGRMTFSAVRLAMASHNLSLIDKYADQARLIDTHPPHGWRAQSGWAIDSGGISDDRKANDLTKLFEEARISELQDAEAVGAEA